MTRVRKGSPTPTGRRSPNHTRGADMTNVMHFFFINDAHSAVASLLLLVLYSTCVCACAQS